MSTSVFVLDKRNLIGKSEPQVCIACKTLASLLGAMDPMHVYEGWAKEENLPQADGMRKITEIVKDEALQYGVTDWVPLFFLHVDHESDVLDSVVAGLSNCNRKFQLLFVKYSTQGCTPGVEPLDVARHGKTAHTISWPTPDLNDIAQYASAFAETLQRALNGNDVNPFEPIENALRLSANAGNARLAKLLFEMAHAKVPDPLTQKIQELEGPQ